MQPAASGARGERIARRIAQLFARRRIARGTLAHEDARLGAAAEDRVELAHVARGERRHERLELAAAGASRTSPPPAALFTSSRSARRVIVRCWPPISPTLKTATAISRCTRRRTTGRQEVGVWTVELGRRRHWRRPARAPRRPAAATRARRPAVRRVEGAEVVHHEGVKDAAEEPRAAGGERGERHTGGASAELFSHRLHVRDVVAEATRGAFAARPRTPSHTPDSRAPRGLPPSRPPRNSNTA